MAHLPLCQAMARVPLRPIIGNFCDLKKSDVPKSSLVLLSLVFFHFTAVIMDAIGESFVVLSLRVDKICSNFFSCGTIHGLFPEPFL
jgi:hypothetical protein